MSRKLPTKHQLSIATSPCYKQYFGCAVALCSIAYNAQDKYNNIHCFLFCFWLCWLHPFFHNGVLYTVRNYFAPEIYKKKFFAKKEDPGKANPQEEKAAWNEFDFSWRLIMFLFGIAAIVVLIYFE